MNPKRAIRYLLITFVVGSIGYVGFREVRGSSAANDVPPDAKMAVYYFSQGKDCTTCENIESSGLRVVEEEFADELAAGDVAWRKIDLDEPGNGHYADKYGLYTKSIVLVAYDDGEETDFLNLKKVWDYVYDDDELASYIGEEARAFWEAHR